MAVSLVGGDVLLPLGTLQALGDCWFISAISVLATDPGRIHELFVTDSRALQPGVKFRCCLSPSPSHRMFRWSAILYVFFIHQSFLCRSAEVEGENGFTLDDCVKWGV